MRTRIAWPAASGRRLRGWRIVGRGDEWRVGRGGLLDEELIHQPTAFGDSCDTREPCVYAILYGLSCHGTTRCWSMHKNASDFVNLRVEMMHVSDGGTFE